MRTMEELLRQYYESWLGLDAVYEKWAARRGVTFNVFNMLTMLYEQAELCRRLHLSKQTVASVIDSLEKRGMAVRRVARDDRRSRVVVLTEAGSAAARELSEAVKRFEIRALSMLRPEEREAMVDAMCKLQKSMEQALAQEAE